MSQTKSPSDRFLFYIFIALFIWLPLPLGSNRPWAISVMEVWVLSLAVGWLTLFVFGRVDVTEAFKRAKPVVICFVLFVLWVAFQSIPLPASWVQFASAESASIQSALSETSVDYMSLSVNATNTASSALKSFCFLLIFLLTLLLLNSASRVKYFAIAIVISGLFQSVYGSLMMLSGVEYTFFLAKEASQGAATGTFINRNHLAGYLEMSLAIGIGLMIASLSRQPAGSLREWFRRLIVTLLGPKARIRIALAIMVIALVLTRSRMGNSAFFFSLAIAGVIGLLGLWWMSRKGKVSIHSVRPILILFISLIVIDLFIVGAWFGIDKVKDRIEQTSFATEIRDEVDIYAVNHLHAFLLTGSGGDTFAEVFPKFKSESFSGYIDHAHNDYLEFGSEFGLIGMALLSVIVVWSFIKSIQAQFIRRSYFMRGVGFSATMGVVAIMIHSAVDFNLQIPANAALFVILLAFGWLARYQRN